MFKIKPIYSVFSLLFVLFIYLILNLFKLQFIDVDKYLQIAEKNFVRIKKIKPVRGQIYDQKYRPIAINQPSLNLYVSIGKIKDRKKLSQFITDGLDQEYKEIFDNIYNNRFRTYQDLLLVQNIPKEKGVQFAEKMDEFPELFFQVESIREYQIPNHFTGYVGKINNKEYSKRKDKGYLLNSLIGKTGLEKMYENLMRGELGYEVIQVDASGKNLGFFPKDISRPAKKGDDLILHLDLDLQNFIHETFPEDTNGSVIVLDVQSGGILAYASEPTFDPNIFLTPISQTTWDSLMSDQGKPMLDRNIQGTYPPGSIFKPLTGALGMDLELIDEHTKLASCDGGMQIGNRYFKCWLHSGHGKTNFRNSLKYSCDVFYYDLSLKYSLDQMHDYTVNNYMGIRTGVDLPNERKGFIPTTKWYRENYGKNISITGHKVNLAIGQGEILTTPLQMVSLYAAIANNGIWKTPHFLDKTLSSDNKKFEQIMKYEEKKLSISEHALNVINDGLHAVVNEKWGTARVCAIPGMTVYGKTGSAENHLGDKTHAWFAGYAKWKEPEIAIVVFMENAGHGGAVAAPYAAKVLEYYQRSIRDSE